MRPLPHHFSHKPPETNSAELRSANTVAQLIKLLSSPDESIQLAAASAIDHIRSNHLNARERGVDLDVPLGDPAVSSSFGSGRGSTGQWQAATL